MYPPLKKTESAWQILVSVFSSTFRLLSLVGHWCHDRTPNNNRRVIENDTYIT